MPDLTDRVCEPDRGVDDLLPLLAAELPERDPFVLVLDDVDAVRLRRAARFSRFSWEAPGLCGSARRGGPPGWYWQRCRCVGAVAARPSALHHPT
jgi:hypothetical protein